MSQASVALQVPDQDAAVNGKEQQTTTPPKTAGSRSSAASPAKKKAALPAQTGFVPSEQIKADSAVSFPADI